MRIHEDGWKFVGIFALVTVILFLISTTLGWIGIFLTVWCFCFFRDPERMTPTRKGLLVSPADGRVVAIKSVIPPEEFGMGSEERTRISIFLNVFDVHINRIPIDGTIQKAIYHPGKFFNASLDKASEYNERQSLVIELNDDEMISSHDKKNADSKNTQDKKAADSKTEKDTKGVSLMAIVQIAGLIARRIRCDVKDGDKVLRGERFGLIRFGSRTDIYLPKNVEPLVMEGQYMIGGETILADLTSLEKRREGIYR